MAVRYALVKYSLDKTPDTCRARVEPVGSVDLASVVDRVVNQGSTVSRADVLATVENLVTACTGLLLEGCRVNFAGLCELFPRVTGEFDGPTDAFDPARHRLDIGANARCMFPLISRILFP